MSQNDSRRQIIAQLTQELRRLERSRNTDAATRDAGSSRVHQNAGATGHDQVDYSHSGEVRRQPEIYATPNVDVPCSEPAPRGPHPDGAPEQEPPEQERDVAAAAQPLAFPCAPSAELPEVVSSGIPALDDLLPEQGLRRGALVEWFAEGEGAGAGTLALLAARQAMQSRGALVVVDLRGEFYAPAAAGYGLDLAQTIILRPDGAADAMWACEQSLRCRGVAAVLYPLDQIHDRAFRRLQLAAERGGSLGLLLRPAARLREPSWASVRLLVQPIATPPAAGGGRLAGRNPSEPSAEID